MVKRSSGLHIRTFSRRILLDMICRFTLILNTTPLNVKIVVTDNREKPTDKKHEGYPAVPL